MPIFLLRNGLMISETASRNSSCTASLPAGRARPPRPSAAPSRPATRRPGPARPAPAPGASAELLAGAREGRNAAGPDGPRPTPRASGLRALDVGLGLAQLGQQRVGRLLLGQGRVEQPLDLVQPDQLRPAAQRAVARDLLVLDRLRRRDQAGVERRAAGELLHHLLAFLQDALDGLARHALGLLAQEPEDLLEALDLLFRLAAVLLERGLELLVLGGAGHLRQGFQYLVFGVVDILGGVQEQALQVLLGHC